MARLAGFVHVTNPDTDEQVAFGPEDTVPVWARQLITNPAAWADGEVPESKAEPETPPSDKTPDGRAAPKGNASTEEWAAHAKSKGIEVPEDAKQKDIRELVAAADKAASDKTPDGE